MTRPIHLERGMRVRYHKRKYRLYGEDAWNGWYGRVLSVDRGTTPWQFVRVRLESPYNNGDRYDWYPIAWTERENLRKLPD